MEFGLIEQDDDGHSADSGARRSGAYFREMNAWSNSWYTTRV